MDMFKFKKTLDDVKKKFRFTKELPPKEPTTADELNEIAAIASECLSSKAFRRYAERMVYIEQVIIKEIMDEAGDFEYNDKTIESFGATVLAKLIKLRSVKSLLLSVHKDVSRGTSEEKKED